MKILFLYPNEPMLNPPPVSIGIFTKILLDHGFIVDLFDTTLYKHNNQTSDEAKLENLQVKSFDFGERNIKQKETDMVEDFQAKVKEYLPDLIAVSILEATFSQTILLLESISVHQIPVIAGGVFPTFAPEMVLENSLIDYVCMGEGEEALLEFCLAIREGKDVTKIKNIAFKKEGQIIINSMRPAINLDDSPIPDYQLFQPERFYRPMAGKVYKTIPIETNRGCPYSCTYCNSPAMNNLYLSIDSGPFFRKKTMARLRQEMTFLINKYNPEYIYFPSDTFLLMNDQEFDEFISIYSEWQLPFWMQTRAETITDKRAKALKNIGCHRMSMGIEHGNYEFRKKILHKSTKNETFINAMSILNESGIPVSVNNILGFPGETRDLVFDTIELNRKIKADNYNAYVFMPFHGTEMYNIALSQGLIQKSNYAKMPTKGSALSLPTLSSNEIEGLRKTFVLYVSLPKKYWARIRIAERNDEEGLMAFDEMKNIYNEIYN